MDLTLIVVLVIVAFILFTLELFMPGAVLATIASVILAVAIILAFVWCGALVGTLLLAGSLAICCVGFCVWAVTFDKTAAGKAMTLTSAIHSEDEHPQYQEYMGRQGITITPLVPSGAAMFGGKKLDVMAESGLIEKGRKIFVTSVDGMKIVVRLADDMNYQSGSPV